MLSLAAKPPEDVGSLGMAPNLGEDLLRLRIRVFSVLDVLHWPPFCGLLLSGRSDHPGPALDTPCLPAASNHLCDGGHHVTLL